MELRLKFQSKRQGFLCGLSEVSSRSLRGCNAADIMAWKAQPLPLHQQVTASQSLNVHITGDKLPARSKRRVLDQESCNLHDGCVSVAHIQSHITYNHL